MTQLGKDRLIEKFMGWELKWLNDIEGDRSGWYFQNLNGESIKNVTYANSVVGFTTDWNLLMTALKKFDNLSISNWKIERYSEYARICDRIDYAVTLYNIDDTVNVLCEGIEWYNSTSN